MFSICHTRWPYKSVGAWSSPKFYCSNVTRVFNFVLVERYSIFFFLFPFNLILIPPVFDDLNPKFYYFNLRDSIYAMCQEIFYSTMTTCRVMTFSKIRFERWKRIFSAFLFVFTTNIVINMHSHFEFRCIFSLFYYILFIEKRLRDFWKV